MSMELLGWRFYNEALLTRTPGVSPKYSKDVIDLTRSYFSFI